MHQGTPTIMRADLAGALEDAARADRNVARVLAVCEAWESGYVASLLTRAEHLAGRDSHDGLVYTTVRERALSAIDRAIRQDNPFQRVHRAGVDPSDDAVDALLEMLHQQARFHGAAADLERRTSPRTPPTNAG